jgi:hypothetical protein
MKTSKKSQLVGLKKSPNQVIFTLKKDKTVPSNLINFFKEIDFSLEPGDFCGFLESRNYSYQRGRNGKDRGSIRKLQDSYYIAKNNGINLYLFIGKNRVFVILETKKDRQQDLSDKFFKYFEFGKIKKKWLTFKFK